MQQSPFKSDFTPLTALVWDRVMHPAIISSLTAEENGQLILRALQKLAIKQSKLIKYPNGVIITKP